MIDCANSTQTHYNQKARSYDEYRTPSPGLFSIRKSFDSSPEGMEVLDLGCGSGSFIPEIGEFCIFM